MKLELEEDNYSVSPGKSEDRPLSRMKLKLAIKKLRESALNIEQKIELNKAGNLLRDKYHDVNYFMNNSKTYLNNQISQDSVLLHIKLKREREKNARKLKFKELNEKRLNESKTEGSWFITQTETIDNSFELPSISRNSVEQKLSKTEKLKAQIKMLESKYSDEKIFQYNPSSKSTSKLARKISPSKIDFNNKLYRKKNSAIHKSKLLPTLSSDMFGPPIIIPSSPMKSKIKRNVNNNKKSKSRKNAPETIQKNFIKKKSHTHKSPSISNHQSIIEFKDLPQSLKSLLPPIANHSSIPNNVNTKYKSNKTSLKNAYVSKPLPLIVNVPRSISIQNQTNHYHNNVKSSATGSNCDINSSPFQITISNGDFFETDEKLFSSSPEEKFKSLKTNSSTVKKLKSVEESLPYEENSLDQNSLWDSILLGTDNIDSVIENIESMSINWEENNNSINKGWFSNEAVLSMPFDETERCIISSGSSSVRSSRKTSRPVSRQTISRQLSRDSQSPINMMSYYESSNLLSSKYKGSPRTKTKNLKSDDMSSKPRILKKIS